MKLGTAGRTVTIGFIGHGSRGVGQLKTLLSMQDVQVNAVCDIYRSKCRAVFKRGCADGGKLGFLIDLDLCKCNTVLECV